MEINKYKILTNWIIKNKKIFTRVKILSYCSQLKPKEKFKS